MSIDLLPMVVLVGTIPADAIPTATHGILQLLLQTSQATPSPHRFICLTRTDATQGVSLVLDIESAGLLQSVAPGSASVIGLASTPWAVLSISEGSYEGNVCVSVALLSKILADAGVSIMVTSSFSGEYVLVPQEQAGSVMDLLDSHPTLGASLTRVAPSLPTADDRVIVGDPGIEGGAGGGMLGISLRMEDWGTPDELPPSPTGVGAHPLIIDQDCPLRIGGIDSAYFAAILGPVLKALTSDSALLDDGIMVMVLDTGDEVSLVADVATAAALEAPIDALVGTGRASSILKLFRDTWTPIHIAENLDLVETGIVASLAGPIADAGIHHMFYQSTFCTDYVIVRESDVPAARLALAPETSL